MNKTNIVDALGLEAASVLTFNTRVTHPSYIASSVHSPLEITTALNLRLKFSGPIDYSILASGSTNARKLPLSHDRYV
ncbi:hypothetical protein A0J61_00048 [Choanephora cucurbitarum]|uniref:Uncharacterized protein n=1 Tax=Choanephora cucurbitarum TaxID=101091 RepID=A0A1C7NS04_9FUNG|nr:hypothetical protein A0J61_00048 [Choanephora cucurbitarum]